MKKVNTLTLKESNITDFAKSRNLMLNNSKEDWNLFLDTDEKIDTTSFNINESYSGYYLKRKNFFLGTFAGEDRIIRLVKKGTGKFVRGVHEYWQPNKGYKVGNLNKTIIHNTAKDLKSYIDKMNNYSTLHAAENIKEGKTSNLIKIIFLPILKFIVTYIKTKNIVFSIMQSFHSFLSWSKMYLKTDKS